ncbi:MAG: PBP1A family penicillin-binding protein [Candidatus Aminicenantes bacterium]|nr:PBP1A family penicillin-binding protein [Candidatus Aminicenantes bacterium]MDH5705189.1 PBP1A family penicillin-binding protein [Candidatus Aminicenantes bacterium]
MAIKFTIRISKKRKPPRPQYAEIPQVQRARKPLKRRILKAAFFFILFSVACFLGVTLGTFLAVSRNLPSISELEEFEPNIITYIYADDGTVIGEYALEKRIEVPLEVIPETLINAIIATEDARFFSHGGLDWRGILRAVREDIEIKLFGQERKLHGGSTISQQLATMLFLHRRQTLRRKFKEAILSLEIEKSYTKRQILNMYCNQFNLANGAWGVEAASQLYFGKTVSELTLEEAALIAGIPRGPTIYDPYKYPDKALERRNHVFDRMVAEGYLSRVEADEAKAKPLGVLPLHRETSEFAAYFREEVRRYLIENYGDAALYRKGLKVYTTLNPTYQRYAEEELLSWLRVLDKRQGWRDDKRNLLEQGIESLEELESSSLEDWPPRSWLQPSLEEKAIVEALVLSVTSEEAELKVKDYKGILKIDGQTKDWTKTENLKTLIKEGDVIQVQIKSINEENKELLVSLDQEPLIEGAFLAIEPQTGQIKVMVGGYSFQRSEWNNATQAKRQAGSAIKPFLYTAAIDSRLFTPANILIDEPTDFYDKWSEEPYSPNNYDWKYKGAVTVRIGIEESRNIPTVKLLESISPQKGVDYCRKFGITTPVYPYLSLALGAPDVKLIEMVSAYSTFPNKGVRVHPYFITRIEDKDGNVLEEAKVESEEVISPQVAYMMTYLLQGAIRHGTGWRANRLNWPLAGKTGTTDLYTDAWYIGFSPSLCAGVWIGHHTPQTIGRGQSGAVAAQPPWVDFFEKVIRDLKKKAEAERRVLQEGEEGNEEKEEEALLVIEDFEVPLNVIFVEIDRKTGLLATPDCLFPFKEVFLPGTEPDRWCSLEDHLRILDYYDKRD